MIPSGYNFDSKT